MFKITDYANIGESDIMRFAAERLNVDGVEIIVIHNERILDKFGTEKWHVNALLHKTPIPNTYELIIRERPVDPVPLIICHEMIHLSQYVRGDLSLDMDRKIFTWKGKEYGPELEYEWRPWEREAFNGQSSLLRAYRKERRKLCK